MGIFARSWDSDGAGPIPVHVAQFERQPVGQEEDTILITLRRQSGQCLLPSGMLLLQPTHPDGHRGIHATAKCNSSYCAVREAEDVGELPWGVSLFLCRNEENNTKSLFCLQQWLQKGEPPAE